MDVPALPARVHRQPRLPELAIAFGYPTPSGEGPIRRFIHARVLRVQGRNPLPDMVHHERWGQREGRAQ